MDQQSYTMDQQTHSSIHPQIHFNYSPPSPTLSAVHDFLSSTRPEVGLPTEPELSTNTALSIGPSGVWSGADENRPTTCDFVRKLYNVLEDQSLARIMCWGPQGNFFIIKDVTAFSADVLGRVFKYSNFASFVRQLNKYDFHKMKTSDNDGLDDHSWTFRHRDFHRGDLKALENIRRKVPGVKANTHRAASEGPPVSNGLKTIHAQIERMAVQQNELFAHIQDMDENYVAVSGGLDDLRRAFVQRDNAIEQILRYTINYGSALQ